MSTARPDPRSSLLTVRVRGEAISLPLHTHCGRVEVDYETTDAWAQCVAVAARLDLDEADVHAELLTGLREWGVA